MPSMYLQKQGSSFWQRSLFCLRCFFHSCWILCCPPCPGPMIRKVAFQPPPPSYHFTTDDGEKKIRKPTAATQELFPLRIVIHKKLWFRSRFADIKPKDLKKAECFFTKTSRGNWIPCLFYPCPVPPEKYTIIYSHPNAQDLGDIAKSKLNLLSIVLQCNVCLYDYSGYGIATGKATEKNMYADVRAVYNAMLKRYKLNPSEIIVMGQSLGVPASVDLARQEKNLAGVVLIAGFCSALNIVDNSRKGRFRKTLACADQFNSLEKMEEISSPVLVIHGQNDELTPFTHGMALYEKCKNPVPPLWHKSSNHNDIDCWPSTWIRIERFISDDLQAGEIYSQIYRKKLKERFAEKRIDLHASCLATANLCHLCENEMNDDSSESYRKLMCTAIVLAMEPLFLMGVAKIDPLNFINRALSMSESYERNVLSMLLARI